MLSLSKCFYLMYINFYLRRFLKFLITSLILSISLFETTTLNKQIKAEKKLVAASEKDLFLYRQMGASYLCIASKAEVDFKKGLGVASATFAKVALAIVRPLLKSTSAFEAIQR